GQRTRPRSSGPPYHPHRLQDHRAGRSGLPDVAGQPCDQSTGDKGSYKKWKSVTPAMAARLTDHIWTMDELLSFRVPPSRCGHALKRFSHVIGTGPKMCQRGLTTAAPEKDVYTHFAPRAPGSSPRSPARQRWLALRAGVGDGSRRS